jgi:hypothetical protein
MAFWFAVGRFGLGRDRPNEIINGLVQVVALAAVVAAALADAEPVESGAAAVAVVAVVALCGEQAAAVLAGCLVVSYGKLEEVA